VNNQQTLQEGEWCVKNLCVEIIDLQVYLQLHLQALLTDELPGFFEPELNAPKRHIPVLF